MITYSCSKLNASVPNLCQQTRSQVVRYQISLSIFIEFNSILAIHSSNRIYFPPNSTWELDGIQVALMLHSFIVCSAIVDFLKFKNVIESIKDRYFDTMVIIMCEYGDISQISSCGSRRIISFSGTKKLSSCFPICSAHACHYLNQPMRELMVSLYKELTPKYPYRFIRKLHQSNSAWLDWLLGADIFVHYARKYDSDNTIKNKNLVTT